MLRISSEIAAALDEGRPVVALESTVISHGLPYPQNLELARAMEDEVRAAGAVPATVGVCAGVPTVGMAADEIERFATRSAQVRKLSRRDVAAAIAQAADGATTVAATMALAAAAGVEVFATGGIGGVHRGAETTWDISADLTELARTPVLVVCAGAKAILDLPATIEYLETLGVPLVGLGTDEFPAFYSRSSGLPVPSRADTPADAARIWAAQRQHVAVAAPGGLLLCVPPPAEVALDRAEVEVAIGRALARAASAGVRGPAVTPFLLAAMAEETHGESIATNVALLRQNARVAGQVAAQLRR
ncbi:pseudouridine-5'-phosphate glycosidase [Oscillochloris sp. ZM17-4]|uniref:pseudouridine-5'-phosphate glycosidase n=1 Tax=Oscillochloris sp. ZM17-4 TaxID=2866714 RepID=UPI001C732E94|nr:pseudouridine-5'-phosphate glycosidase [Oscillochloris sp. ZM17-4]MBX0327836.1 pseudouridine-5'-phosphate glycosidase [Oscillochloris sp. ZM17-4]